MAEAMKWYRKSADQGVAGAQFSLGNMYFSGHGIPHDDVEAVKWYRKAADQGDAYGQFYLGGMYEMGYGVPQDNVEACMWFNLSTAQGNTNAEKRRDSLARKMTPSQIAEAQILAEKWKPKGR